jgi:hypothetical protein
MWGAAMDAGGWLRGLGFGQYETNFQDNKIDADLLPRLKDAGLVARYVRVVHPGGIFHPVVVKGSQVVGG